jgi:predicted ATPase
MSLVRWLQGYPDEATAWSCASLEHAKDASHSNTWGYTLCFGGVASEVMRREIAGAERHASDLIRFSEDRKLPVWLAYARIMHGWTIAQAHATEDGISEMKAGLVHFEDASSKTAASDSLCMGFMKSFLLSLFGEAHGKLGRAEDGLTHLDAAWSFAEASGEGFWKAEILRLKGELLVAAGRSSDADREAEACFLKARKIAFEQGARGLELRAVISLSRLRQRERPDDSRRLLHQMFSTFTEGFGSVDLLEAHQLLDELSGARGAAAGSL